MSAARRRGVGTGDRILAGGIPNVVVSVSGTHVRLADDAGTVQTVTAADLADGTRFAIPSPASPRGPRPETGLEGLPAAAVEEASWWEAHIAEVVYGLRPDAPAGTRPRPQYDPERTSLTGREKAKAAELSAPGKPVPASTVKHRRQRWEAYGLPGLADRRLSRRKRPAGRADEQVVAAVRQAIGETPDASSKTAGFTIWRAKEILARAGYDGLVPSDRTLYRLFGALSYGRHVTGAASTRRSLAGRPEGMFGSLPAAAPGEVVQIDSTPLDVLVLLDDGVPGRVELTGMIDVATRVVPAAVLRPTTRSVDASVLLARALTPEPARPGWPEALKMAHSVLPYERLLDIDARLEQAAARPVIVPDTIVIDHGSVFISAAFRSACRHLGISVQPAHLGSGAEKGCIERYFGSVGSLFCQFASGYAGRSTDRRGRHAGDQPLWSMAELQELLDEWLAVDEIHNVNLGTRHGAEASDTLKYFAERLPVTFAYAGISVERAGLLSGTRGEQIAGRFSMIRTGPFGRGQQWQSLIAALEDSLRLHHHRDGTLTGLAPYLHSRSGGMIGSLLRLIRAGAVQAVLDGTETITKATLESIPAGIASAGEHLPG